MRAGIENFLTAYDKPAPPAEIRQQPLDGDQGHYARLSALDDGALPAPRDFGDYASDICYMEEVQPALFANLLPACLQVWRHDLMHDHRSDYAGSIETFQCALARPPPSRAKRRGPESLVRKPRMFCIIEQFGRRNGTRHNA